MYEKSMLKPNVPKTYCPPQAADILTLATQLFTFAVQLQLQPGSNKKLLSSFWALERAAHVQEAILRLSEKLLKEPVGRDVAIKCTLCVLDAAQRQFGQQQKISGDRPGPPQKVAAVDERSIRHLLKLLDVTTQDPALAEGEDHSELSASMGNSVSIRNASGHTCAFLHLAWATGAVTGHLVTELCFSPGLARVVAAYSAGDSQGDGETIACTALSTLIWATHTLRDGADVFFRSKTRVSASTVEGKESIEMVGAGISEESIRSLLGTTMEAVRQAAAVQKLRAVPLTSRSKAIQKALTGGYLQVGANCTSCKVYARHTDSKIVIHVMFCLPLRNATHRG